MPKNMRLGRRKAYARQDYSCPLIIFFNVYGNSPTLKLYPSPAAWLKARRETLRSVAGPTNTGSHQACHQRLALIVA